MTVILKPRGTKTKLQVKAIFGLARQRGLDNERLHELVSAETGKASIRALNRPEADQVIIALGGQAMTGRARRTEQHYRRRAGVAHLVTAAQMARLNQLAATRWPEGWEQALGKLCRRMIRRDTPATTIQANKVIEALKGMNAREGK